MQVVENIVYASEAGDAGKGDLYLPRDPDGARVVLMLHGGGWMPPLERSRMHRFSQAVAELGYAVFNIDYRLLTDARYPACEEDCLAAGKFLLEGTHDALAPLDRSAIAVIGASAGGHLSLLTGLGLPRERVVGIVDIAGPTDLTTQDKDGRFCRADVARGYAPDEVESVLWNASPVNRIGENPPPLLVVHNVRDTVVEVEHSEWLFSAWTRSQGEIWTYIYAGSAEAGHDIWDDVDIPIPEIKPDILEHIHTFLSDCFVRSH